MYQCECSIAGQARKANEIIRVFRKRVLAFSFLAATGRDPFLLIGPVLIRMQVRWNEDASSALGR
jgi:hypothetical protein